MENKPLIKRAGCFEGKVDDPKAKCEVEKCYFASDCIWKKDRADSRGLGGVQKNRRVIISHG